MEDTIHHKQLREAMIDVIRSKGITNKKVLNAIGQVPRHLFIEPSISAKEAYEDKPMEIGEGQTISQPYTVAYQTELLEVNENEKILEIGTGSGYQASVLFLMGARVYTIERQKKLYYATKLRLAELGYNGIRTFYGDGNEGLEKHEPFDKILVTAAAPGIPAKLVDQLKVGGMMVIPVNGKVHKMLRVLKLSPTETKIQEYDDFRFVPLLTGVAGDHK
jgi:protein-L-isoaspartate(D-aspartate) O-methyltransferase